MEEQKKPVEKGEVVVEDPVCEETAVPDPVPIPPLSFSVSEKIPIKTGMV